MRSALYLVEHADLTPREIDALRELFDAEYRDDYGSWDPEKPYGYSPADFHVLVRAERVVVGHIGFQRRRILVGSVEVDVGGVGGVLVAPEARGHAWGRRAMAFARDAMRDVAGVDFGYLGCREAVVPFYEASGWRRIDIQERSLSRLDRRTVVEASGTPILICGARRSVEEWPDGPVDLCGTPW